MAMNLAIPIKANDRLEIVALIHGKFSGDPDIVRILRLHWHLLHREPTRLDGGLQRLPLNQGVGFALFIPRIQDLA
jgi:hypothetical protein